MSDETRITRDDIRAQITAWRQQTPQCNAPPLTWSALNSDYTLSDARRDRRGYQLARTDRTRLAIVCGAPTKRHAPLNDDRVEVWALNSVIPRDQTGAIRADLWWEMHPMFAQRPDELRFLAQIEQPCITVDPEMAPAGIGLAVETMTATHHWPVYFACTMAYQVMYAAHLLRFERAHFTRVELYGVELLLGNAREHSVEAACLSFWLGILWPLAEVVVPDIPGGLLRHPYRYGYDYLAEQRDVDLLCSAQHLRDDRSQS